MRKDEFLQSFGARDELECFLRSEKTFMWFYKIDAKNNFFASCFIRYDEEPGKVFYESFYIRVLDTQASWQDFMARNKYSYPDGVEQDQAISQFLTFMKDNYSFVALPSFGLGWHSNAEREIEIK